MEVRGSNPLASTCSYEGDGPAPAADSAPDLDRQARHLEAARARYEVQVRQLLDLAVLALYPREAIFPLQV